MDRLVVAGVTEVVVGRSLGADQVFGASAASRVAVITQPGAAHVAAPIMAGLPVPATLIEVPDGEAAKTLAAAGAVVERLLAFGLDRHDLVVAVGGGTVTDLAGFVASIYLRGIDVHHVPTTLLGAVDAAIGGKTGVNLAAKNQIGTIHQPKRVVVDLDVLDRLPDVLRREGAAEALKAGLIADPEIVVRYEQDGLSAPLDGVVARAIRVKADIVGRDAFEVGERAHLNYGHTIGHALEVAAGMSHGDAVAVGMVAAGRASALLLGFGEEQRQHEVIARLGLPVSVRSLDRAAVHRLISHDKKRAGDGIRMVLLEAIGRPQVTAVGATTVEAALDTITPGGDRSG